MNETRIRHVSQNAAKSAVNVDLLGLSPLGELKSVLGSLIVSAVFDKEHSRALSQKMTSWMQTVKTRVANPQSVLDGVQEHAWNQLGEVIGGSYQVAKQTAEGQQIAVIVQELRKQFLAGSESNRGGFQLPAYSLYGSGRPVLKEHDAIRAAFTRSSDLPSNPHSEPTPQPTHTPEVVLSRGARNSMPGHGR